MIRGAFEWTPTGLRGITAVKQRRQWTLLRTFEREWTHPQAGTEFITDPHAHTADLTAIAREERWQTVYCVLPRSEVIAIHLQSSKQDILQTAKEQLPWAIEEAAYDVFHGEVSYLLAANRKRLAEYEKTIAAAGLTLGGIQLSAKGVTSLLGGFSDSPNNPSLESLALKGSLASGPWILRPEKSPAALQTRRIEHLRLVAASVSLFFVALGFIQSRPHSIQAITPTRAEELRITPVLLSLLQRVPKGATVHELTYDAAQQAVHLRGVTADHAGAAGLFSEIAKVSATRSIRNEKTALNAGGGVEFTGEVILR